jgi:hypothetical protein
MTLRQTKFPDRYDAIIAAVVLPVSFAMAAFYQRTLWTLDESGF